MDKLKKTLEPEQFEFYDGCSGGLRANGKTDKSERFVPLNQKDHERHGTYTIEMIAGQAAERGKVAIVISETFVLKQEDDGGGVEVHTGENMDSYTYILYLDVPAEVVAKRRSEDRRKSYKAESVKNLVMRQIVDKIALRELCNANQIPFMPVVSSRWVVDDVSKLIQNFIGHREDKMRRVNSSAAVVKLEPNVEDSSSRE